MRRGSTSGHAAWWSTYFDRDYLTEHEPMLDAARTRAEAGRLLDVLGLPVGAPVLDVPCGQGRHAELLAEAGLDVTGLDYSETLLRVARGSARRAAVRYVRGDMRALPASWTGTFDAVVSLGASFGFFDTPAEDARVIQNYARVLGPGGVLVLHAVNRDGVAAGLVEKDWWESRDGTLVTHEREFDPLSGIVSVRRVLRPPARNRRPSSRSYRIRVYTATEMSNLAAAHGLTVTDAFDGWRVRPLRRRSPAMLLRATRTA